MVQQPGSSGRSGRFTATVVLSVAIVTVALVAGALVLIDEEDRPLIIVRNGSVIFDGGDPLDVFHDWTDWIKDATGDVWRPDQPNGRSVGAFEVALIGADAAGPAACSSGSLRGTDVVVTSRRGGGVETDSFRISRKWRLKMAFPKREPAVEAPGAMTLVPGTPKAPPSLRYPSSSESWISNVTVGNTSCPFPQVSGPARDAVRVYIKPRS